MANPKLQLTNIKKELNKLYSLDFLSDFLAIPRAKTYLFGGAVRDILLNRPIKEADIRITLNKTWTKREKAVEQSLRNFKIIEKTRIEPAALTIYRFLPPSSRTKHDIDLSLTPTLNQNKPDFTINSLFVDLKTGQVIDKYRGQADLRKKILRTVKSPDQQFKQEPQMIFRAVKCLCQFNLKAERATYSAMKQNAGLTKKTLAYIAETRTGILPELFLSNIFRGLAYNAKQCFAYYENLGVTQAMLEFMANQQNLPLAKTKKYPNPFAKKSNLSFAGKLSVFLSFLTSQLISGNKEKTFGQIKKILTLDKPKQYLDLEVDIKKIKYNGK